MQNIETLNNNYKQFIDDELRELDWDDDKIKWAIFSGECKFCEDREELKDAIKQLWDEEFESDSELDDYILHNRRHIIPLYDRIAISYIVC